MDLGDALAWLDSHQNLERMLADTRAAPPDLRLMRRLVDVMGSPQASVPVLHITGTNGKTSTARALTQLLMAKGLSVGTFTSPHLESLNERITANGQPISDRELAELLTDVASLEPIVTGEHAPEGRLTWFEILAGSAFRWFADRPVDVSVIEVGLGGRWDATNVADATVAVVTNIGLDHVEFLGPERADVAAEKAGIVKPGSTLILGETDPDLVEVFAERHPAALWLAGREYRCRRNEVAVGGRALDLSTPGGSYESIWLDLHGAHQADNFAAALAAAEAFFGTPLEDRLVRQAAATVRSPGRMEVIATEPLVILDGAKNVEGARCATLALDEEFSSFPRIMVVGMLRGKDPGEMLAALGAASARLVVACPPPSPRAQPAAVVAAAAAHLGVTAEVADSVSDALSVALAAATTGDLVLVTGSLYTVGAARAALRGRH